MALQPPVEPIFGLPNIRRICSAVKKNIDAMYSMFYSFLSQAIYDNTFCLIESDFVRLGTR